MAVRGVVARTQTSLPWEGQSISLTSQKRKSFQWSKRGQTEHQGSSSPTTFGAVAVARSSSALSVLCICY